MAKNPRTKEGKISRQAILIIILLFLLTVISNADKAIIGFASVPLMEELGLNAEQWGIIGSAFFFLYSIFAIIGGTLADRFGAKIVIAVMAIVWATVQFSTLFVSSFTFLLITRIILGAGEGPSYSLAMTAATKYLPKEKLGIGLTLVSVGGPLGVAMSAPILISLITQFGWRSAFLATCIVGLIWVVFWLMIAENDRKEAIAKYKANRQQGQQTAVSKFGPVLRSKNFILIAICGFATYWSFTIGLNWLPNYLENVRQLSAETLSIVAALPWIMITISQITFSTVSDRLFKKTKSIVKGRVFVLGPVMLAGAVSYFIGTILNANMLVIAFLSLGLTFGCITLVLGPTILSSMVSKEHIGKVQGWFMAFTSLGGIVGPYITGLLIERSATQAAGFHMAFQLCGIILLICGGLVWLFVRPNKDENIQSNVA